MPYKDKAKHNKYNNEWHKRYYKEHPEKRREWYWRHIAKVRALLGDKCVRCGFSDWRALQIDHKNGDGAKDRRALGRGQMYYARIFKLSPEELCAKFQLLCANCNWIKRHEEKSWWKKISPS